MIKKVIILAIVFLVFTFGVVFGKSWAQNSWITAAVNKGLEASGQKDRADLAAKLDGLHDCKLIDGIKDTSTGKEANLQCLNKNDEKVRINASATKDGKFLFFQKYDFNGIEVL